MDRFAGILKDLKNSNIQLPSEVLRKVERFLEAGGKAGSLEVPRLNEDDWVSRAFATRLVEALERPDAWTERDERAAQILGSMKTFCSELGEYLNAHVERERPDEDLVAPVRRAFESAGIAPAKLAQLLIDVVKSLQRDGKPSSAGQHLLGCDTETLIAALAPYKGRFDDVEPFRADPFIQLIATHAPARLLPLVEALTRTKRRIVPETLACILRSDPARCANLVLSVHEKEKDPWQRFLQASELYEVDPATYGPRARDLARTCLAGDTSKCRPDIIAERLVKAFGREAVADLTAHLASKNSWGSSVVAALAPLRAEATPALLAALASADPEARYAALGLLIDAGDPAQDARIDQEITRGLKETAPQTIIGYLGLATRWKPQQVEGRLWPLLGHASKPVREAAVRGLARMGEAVVERTVGLLADRKADVRSAAVALLAALGLPAGLAALEARVDVETSEDVRDEILVALEEAFRRAGRTLTRAEVEARITRAAPHLAEPVVPWIKEKKLPPLRFKDGAPLDARAIRYLFYRQGRTKEMRADVEARALYELIDRTASDPFALAVVESFVASGAAAGDRWALALAGLLGGDAVVSVLVGLVRTWVDGNRGKLAEYAVEALSLVGSDLALAAVDGLALRYRSKMKNVGRAATEAFARAAEARGIDPDELGDRVAPWLGFQPSEQRVLELGKARVAVEIGVNFKLRFTDLDKGKSLASLPKGAPKAIADEMKELAAMLREVAKAQLLRLEGLLTRQRRWPSVRWRELYLAHPLLRPFAVRLVWGAYDQAGRLAETFRALDDGSLTTAADDVFALAKDHVVGIVHPLELDAPVLDAWRTHLGEHEVEPPFPQLDRIVVRVTAEQRELRQFSGVSKTELNAMTFKGRAERRGWRRGSVVDAGGITGYVKSFAGAGIDVLLTLHDFFIGAGIYDNLTVGDAYFVRAGTVTFGSYTYDEPTGADDPRLLPLGQVPPIVFSEAMGDLQAIAGRGSADDAADD